MLKTHLYRLVNFQGHIERSEYIKTQGYRECVNLCGQADTQLRSIEKSFPEHPLCSQFIDSRGGPMLDFQDPATSEEPDAIQEPPDVQLQRTGKRKRFHFKLGDGSRDGYLQNWSQRRSPLAVLLQEKTCFFCKKKRR